MTAALARGIDGEALEVPVFRRCAGDRERLEVPTEQPAAPDPATSPVQRGGVADLVEFVGVVAPRGPERGPVNPCGVERMKVFHMRNLIGNPHEAAIAAASLIFGGVLDDFPKLQVVLPHAGGSFPWLIGRYDNGVAMRKELAHMKQPASAYLRRFYYDTISHEPKIIRYLIDLVGADRIVIGSDYNFDAGYPRPVEFVDEIPGLTKSEREQILSTNAMEVLKLKERFRKIYDALN